MAPLFDLEPLTRQVEPAASSRPARDRATRMQQRTEPAATPTPINYWVRGVFRCGDGQFIRTVQAVGMSTRIDADVARFTRYLATEGFQFAEGRGVLIHLLDVGAEDGSPLAPAIEVGKNTT